MGLDSLSMAKFDGLPGDVSGGLQADSPNNPSALNSPNLPGSRLTGADSQTGSSGQGVLSDSTKKVLADADKQIAQTGQQHNVSLVQGTGGHGDRVVNAVRVYNKLSASGDTKAANEFLAKMETIGKPLGLNFGLSQPGADGKGPGKALNDGVAAGLKGDQRTEYDKVSSQFNAGKAVPQQDATPSGQKQNSSQGVQQQSGSKSGQLQGGGLPNAQQIGSPGKPQQNSSLSTLLRNVAMLNRNGDSDKIGLQEVQRALGAKNLQPADQQTLMQLGKTIQQNGGKPITVQQALSLSSTRNGGVSGQGSLTPMRQQGGPIRGPNLNQQQLQLPQPEPSRRVW